MTRVPMHGHFESELTFGHKLCTRGTRRREIKLIFLKRSSKWSTCTQDLVSRIITYIVISNSVYFWPPSPPTHTHTHPMVHSLCAPVCVCVVCVYIIIMKFYAFLMLLKSAVCSPLSVRYGAIKMTAILYIYIHWYAVLHGHGRNAESVTDWEGNRQVSSRGNIRTLRGGWLKVSFPPIDFLTQRRFLLMFWH